ncbi:MAG: hypothetical protein A2X93_04700 [Deltaproteobacteria bacterium GWC2_56_8]|nr:MAG: hypothetical protein A2X93_04700 [Deltaproteobacteria bacterium GWC2_56_8]
MKAKADMAKFTRAIAVVDGLHSSRPEYRYIFVEAVDGRLTFAATDGEISIFSSCEAAVEEKGSIYVSAGPLANLASLKGTGEASISVGERKKGDNTEPTLQIRSKAGRYTLAALEQCFTLPELKGAGFVAVDGEKLKPFLKAAATLTRRDAGGNVTFTAIKLENGEKGLRIVSTDGYRILVADVPDMELPVPAECFIPKTGAARLASVLTKDAGAGFIGKEYLAVKNESVSVAVRLMEGQFVDYRQIISSVGSDIGFSAEAPVLRAAVARMVLASIKVDVAASGGVLTLSAKGDGGEVEGEESIGIESNKAGFEGAFNGRFLLDGLDLSGEGPVTLSSKGAEHVFFIRPKDAGGMSYYLMPMNR